MMIKRTLIFLALLLGPCYTTPTRPQQTGVVERSAASYTPVLVKCGGVPIGSGSGVYIQPNLVLSAGHVFTQDCEPSLLDDAKGEFGRHSNDPDLLLISTKRRGRPVTLEQAVLYERIYAIGTPLGSVGVVSFGHIAAISTNGMQLLIDARVLRGFSGGPLFNVKGQLVGIVVGAWGDETGTYMVAVSTKAILLFLEEK